jgi:hypothetical protein
LVRHAPLLSGEGKTELPSGSQKRLQA